MSIKISLKSVPKGTINNIPSLVQIMACRRPGDKPLYDPMMTLVTRPQWVKGYSALRYTPTHPERSSKLTAIEFQSWVCNYIKQFIQIWFLSMP